MRRTSIKHLLEHVTPKSPAFYDEEGTPVHTPPRTQLTEADQVAKRLADDMTTANTEHIVMR